MTTAYRNTVFYLLVLLFFVLGGVFVLYSQGYRFDFETLRLTKVGAIYVSSTPKDARIFLNNTEIHNQSWLLQDGTFINTLFPKRYAVALTAAGYKDFHRTVVVSPSFVTEVKNVLLIPLRPTEVVRPSSGAFFDFAVTGAGLATQDTDGTITFASTTASSSILLGVTHAGDGLLSYHTPSRAFIWSLPSRHLSYRLGAVAVPAQGVSSTNSPVVVDPFESDSVIVKSGQQLFAVSPSTNEKEQLATFTATSTYQPHTLSFAEDTIAWSTYNPRTGTSHLTMHTKAAAGSVRIDQSVQGKTLQLTLLNNSTAALLQDTGELYLFNLGSRTATKIATEVHAFAFSPNRGFVLAATQKTIELIALNEKTLSVSFPFAQSPHIVNLAWHSDNQHVFATFDDGTVRLLDTKDTLLQGFDEVGVGTHSAYDIKTNALYMIRDGALVKYEF